MGEEKQGGVMYLFSFSSNLCFSLDQREFSPWFYVPGIQVLICVLLFFGFVSPVSVVGGRGVRKAS